MDLRVISWVCLVCEDSMGVVREGRCTAMVEARARMERFLNCMAAVLGYLKTVGGVVRECRLWFCVCNV